MAPAAPIQLAYCTNVHAGETLAQIWETLRLHAVPLKAAVSPRSPLGVGLYLPATAAEPLAERPESAADFRGFLAEAGLSVFTVNAFPYGGFHGARVKESVYRPDWTTPRRLAFTIAAGKALASLLAEGETGTVSTLPIAWKGAVPGKEGLALAAGNLLAVAESFRRIREESGRTLVLCLEPEPLCVLETTAETVDFFQRHLSGSETARRHLGVCFDACHLAVEFEDLAASVRRYAGAGIRIGKAQISSALAVARPGTHPEAVARLKGFDEPRFLHQVAAKTAGGILRLADLSLLDITDGDWASAEEWRCHFHVPVDRAEYPPLGTTQAELKAALPALLKLPERPHFEIETYTWSALPEPERPATPEALVAGIAREFAWARQALGARDPAEGVPRARTLF